MMKRLAGAWLCLMILSVSCKKETEQTPDPNWRYFEVGIKNVTSSEWRDTAFVVATSDAALLAKIEAQLAKPVNERQIVFGKLAPGSGAGGYNKNAGHTFKWHLKEDEWELVDMTIEIYDGRPYSDLDLEYDYFMGSVKRYGAWGSYIRKELMK